MSIIRLSCIKSDLYAPQANGTLVKQPYVNGAGLLGTFNPPDKAALKTSDSPDSLEDYLTRSLRAACRGLKQDASAPVTILVHGFLFDPDKGVATDPAASDNPHSRVYHFTKLPFEDARREHTASWPLGLGYTAADQDGAEGVILAYGWLSQPGFATSLLERFQNFYARAYDYGEMSAWPLLRTLLVMQDLEPFATRLPAKRFDIFVHSLGTHLVTRMIAEIAKAANPANRDEYMPAIRSAARRLLDRLGRVIFLGGSEYIVEAQLMYSRLEALGYMKSANPTQPDGDPAGPTFYNIACRENDVLDLLAENFGPRTFGNSQVIGHNGLSARPKSARWIDLQIDSGALKDWMRAAPRNHDISGDDPKNVWDHWYYYSWPGNMRFYADVLRNRALWHLDKIRSGEQPIPEGVRVGWLGD
jgi:hypothetical protein